jgi:hypothetical protein
VKIDGTLVRGWPATRQQRVKHLGPPASIQTIAERVEDANTMAFVAIGVQYSRATSSTSPRKWCCAPALEGDPEPEVPAIEARVLLELRVVGLQHTCGLGRSPRAPHRSH